MSASLQRSGTRAVILVASLILLSGGLSIWSSRNQAASLHHVKAAAEQLRLHMEADMVHDAVRSDVYAIIAADRTNTDITQTRADLERHSALLVENVGKDQVYPLSAEVRAAAAKAMPEVEAYTRVAKQIAYVNEGDLDALSALLPTFMQKFEELEVDMAAVSDAIEEHASKVRADAEFSSLIAALLIALGSLASLAVVLVLARYARKSVLRPLHELIDAIQRMAGGELNTQVPGIDRSDELGALATATLAFRDQINAAEQSKTEQTEMLVSSVGEGLSQLAAGNLSARIDADLIGPFASLKSDFNNALSALRQTMGEISAATDGINRGSTEIRQSSEDLSRRTEQQAANLEETAAAMNQMTDSVRHAADEASRANTLVNTVRTEAQRGGEVVNRAVDAMGGIQRASEEISQIIAVIDGIAFQTNLLALNAGVEAARAGEAGKGFAVVASEVRALAQRSAEAANDVKSRIMSSVGQVSSGVELVNESGAALSRIIEQINAINKTVSTIAEASKTQSAGLEQINSAVREMDGMTQQNAAMVEQATAAARSLSDGADQLAGQVGRFKLAGGGDRARVKAPVALAA